QVGRMTISQLRNANYFAKPELYVTEGLTTCLEGPTQMFHGPHDDAVSDYSANVEITINYNLNSGKVVAVEAETVNKIGLLEYHEHGHFQDRLNNHSTSKEAVLLKWHAACISIGYHLA